MTSEDLDLDAKIWAQKREKHSGREEHEKEAQNMFQ